MTVLAMLSFVALLSTVPAVAAYSSNSSPGSKSIHDLNRRTIAGLWRLTPRAEPMKEFTVYPKRPRAKDPELLLMLKEDGSFEQYDQEEEEDEDEQDVDASWLKFQETQKKQMEKPLPLQGSLIKGTWDYIDGKLILAADRPGGAVEPKQTTANSVQVEQQPFLSKIFIQKHRDTLLVGRVVATHETRLTDNPVVSSSDTTASVEASSNTTTAKTPSPPTPPTTATASNGALDTHLSVPKGSVKIGKFMYPKKHPSFFDQPMFQPTRAGSFTLQQVLGALNTGIEDEKQDPPEKFRQADLYNRTFLLTSHPIGVRHPKGRPRWSLRQNRYVQNQSEENRKAQAADANRPANIRVMQVQLHANNTFSTLAGLGESILRGKYFIIGHEKDQLWMTVSRFGFGRSVSGSVYSEGRMLTHEDAKTYWGTISYVQDDKSVKEEEQVDAEIVDATVEPNDSEPKRLEITGSVLFGSGLEPMPVGRFIMKEIEDQESILLDVDEEEEDEEDDDEEEVPLADLDSTDIGDEGIDWSTNGDAFQ